MKNFLYGVGAAILIGVVGFVLIPKSHTTPSAPSVGGDFAGGVTPSQLLSGSVSGGYVTPIGSFGFASTNGFYNGGTAAANEVTMQFTATSTYPANSITLGNISQTSSTATTSVAFSASGFSVGDACSVTYAGAPSAVGFGADSFVTAVSGSAVTSTVTVWSGSAANLTLNSSTLKVTCFHTGV